MFYWIVALVNIIDDLNKRGIGFKVLTGSGSQIDTSTANGRLCFGLFATLAEYERELIVGVPIAKRQKTTVGKS